VVQLARGGFAVMSIPPAGSRPRWCRSGLPARPAAVRRRGQRSALPG